jgi:membrane dipeptidase
MNRRQFLTTVGVGGVASDRALRVQAGQQSAGTVDELYQRAYAIDAMCFAAAPPRTYVQHLTDEKIAALRTSGITAMAMNMTANYAELSLADSLFAAVRDRIDTWDRFVAEHSDVFVKVTNMAELDAAKRSGKVGFIYCFQMSAPFGWDLDKLATYADMGVRQIQFVDGRRNYLVDSCWEPANAGLSQFGFDVVDALNARGVIIDLSHVGEQSALDAILASNAPVLFSHSGCLALCPHPRNVSDRNIRAMANRGGVFCVYNQSGWLTRDPMISIDHFIDHLDHVINLGGEDHVGVGTDQDAVDMTAMRPDEVERHQATFDRRRAAFPQLTWRVRHMRVPELSHPRRLLHLAQALDQRGYRTGTIEKIIGGNYVRLFRDVAG